MNMTPQRWLPPWPPSSTSPSASSTSSIDGQRPKKRRTYVARKEEIAELLDEMELLQERLALLQTTPPDQRAELSHNWQQVETLRRSHAALVDSATRQYALQTAIREHQLQVAGAQSLLTSELMRHSASLPAVPFARAIRLPLDPSDRQQVLRSLKDAVLRDAAAFMLARRESLDLRRTSHHADEFDLANGDLHSIHWDATPFFGDSLSVRDVFDELLFFMANQEMSATDHLVDTVTLRENDDDHETHDIAQARLVTTLSSSLTLEKNLVVFMQYAERSPIFDAPHAILVIQSVEDDEQFPYQPHDRLRHDITAVVFVTAASSDCISMTRWASTHVHCHVAYARAAARFAKIGASKAQADEWRDDFDANVKRAVHGWCDLMLTTMKEHMRARQRTALR